MSETQQFCTFYLENLYFGIAVEQVQEVIRHQEMTRVPLAPRMIEGLINLRGQIVTAVDLRRRLEIEPRGNQEVPMNVVVRSSGGAVSLLVDTIGEVVEVDEADHEAVPPTVKGVARELISGACKLEGKLLLILNMERAIEAGKAASKPHG
jgi:purine-binding chemotaxis protein CheW